MVRPTIDPISDIFNMDEVEQFDFPEADFLKPSLKLLGSMKKKKQNKRHKTPHFETRFLNMDKELRPTVPLTINKVMRYFTYYLLEQWWRWVPEKKKGD